MANEDLNHLIDTINVHDQTVKALNESIAGLPDQLSKALIDALSKAKPPKAEKAGGGAGGGGEKGSPTNPIKLKASDLVKEPKAAGAAAAAAAGGAKGGGAGGLLGGLLKGASGGLVSLTGGIKGIMAPLTSLPGKIGMVANVIQSLILLGPQILQAALPYVKAFNPALVNRFNLAFENLQAAIGGFLTPIVEVGKQVADQFNAMFTALSPIIKPVIEQLAGVFKVAADAVIGYLQPAIQSMVPFIASLGQMFGTLISFITPILGAAAALMPFIYGLMTAFQSVMNLIMAVAVPAMILVGGVLQILAAILQPIISGLEMFNDVMGALSGMINDIFKEFNDLFKDIAEAIKDFMKSLFDVKPIIDLIKNAFREVVSWVRRLVDWIRDLLGVPRRQQGPTTTAAREARFIDTLEIGRQLRLATMGQVQRNPVEVAQQGNNLLQQILTQLAAIGTGIVTVATNVLQAPQNLFNNLSNTIRHWLQWAAYKISDAFLSTVPALVRPNNPIEFPGNNPPRWQ